MNERIGVFVAWPYANGDLHLGHVAGAYLPADVFARYHRLRGDHVLMVSGSDAHGTPITLRAEAEGISPRAYFERYHQRFLAGWQGLGISFDLFTHTDTERHAAVAQRIFRTLHERGHIFLDRMPQLYCAQDARFLPDRYVEGTCPHCGFAQARGDQCDHCGRTLDAVQLLHPRCRLCGAAPVVREAEQFFLDLPAFQDRLAAYIAAQRHWRPNVRGFAQRFVEAGLPPRAITRDLAWGIPAPVAGYEQKVLYVWFEAVIGYLSASMAWAAASGDPAAWERWWRDPAARSYYFVGKDNIPFHTVIWPAELLAYDPALALPYNVPANEFLTLEGAQFSTSRDWAVWLPDALARYAPDALRYYLTSIAPETGDGEFTWRGFVEHNNNELLATWGNLAQRVLSFAHARYDGRVPAPGTLDERDRQLLDHLAAGFAIVGDRYARAQPRAALEEAMALARAANRYLDAKAPWFQIKQGPEAAATTIYVALCAIDALTTLLAPVLPHSCERLHRALGYSQPFFGPLAVEEMAEETRAHHALRYRPTPEEGRIDRWQPGALEPGRALQPLAPLFARIESAAIEEEQQRLRVQRSPA